MRNLKIVLGIAVWLLISAIPKAQELTQVIRGKVIDAESQTPLPFASVTVTTIEPALGVMADGQGCFRIEEVPIGRHDLKVSFIGYETQMIPELMVSTGKEIVLQIEMKEEISKLEEVVIQPIYKRISH